MDGLFVRLNVMKTMKLNSGTVQALHAAMDGYVERGEQREGT